MFHVRAQQHKSRLEPFLQVFLSAFLCFFYAAFKYAIIAFQLLRWVQTDFTSWQVEKKCCGPCELLMKKCDPKWCASSPKNVGFSAVTANPHSYQPPPTHAAFWMFFQWTCSASVQGIDKKLFLLQLDRYWGCEIYCLVIRLHMTAYQSQASYFITLWNDSFDTVRYLSVNLNAEYLKQGNTIPERKECCIYS